MKLSVNFPKAFDSETPLTWEDVSKRSEDNQAMLSYWDKTDDIMGGIDAMRQSGETRLPKFPDEKQIEYDFRLQNTEMTNIYSDVVEGLASKPFEEEITIEDKNKSFEEFCENVDGSGNNLTQFAAVTFFNGINSAIDWIFIDYPNLKPGQIRSKAEQERAGIRPFWSRVIARNMLEAKTKIINGSETLIHCRILEPGKPMKVREFKRNDAGLVNWTVYTKNENSKTGMMIEDGDEGFLTIGVIPLVPFATGRRLNKGFNFRPALKAAVDLQVELYQKKAH